MLKTVSSVANAIGALNYKGTWNASTNTPAIASGVGAQGDYYVVSVAGATSLDGITNWGVGDWATFNGSVWQRVEGGADGNFVNLDVTATSTTNTLNINSASSAIRLQTGGVNRWVWEKDATNLALYRYDAGGAYQGNPLKISNVNGSANFEGNVSFNAGSGIDFSATAGTGTSELLDDYEEGVWTPNISDAVTGGNVGGGFYDGRYTKVGNLVYVTGYMINGTTAGMTSGNDLYIQGLPFTSINEASLVVSGSVTTSAVTTTGNLTTNLLNNVTAFRISESVSGAAEDYLEVSNLSTGNSDLFFTFSYRAA